jgi:hypothetical protein
MLRSTLSAAAVLLAATVAVAADLKSGPQVGDSNPGGFSSRFINGPYAGLNRCPV